MSAEESAASDGCSSARSSRPSVGAVVVAAGSGTRYGSTKQLLSLRGKPLAFHSIELLARLEPLSELVVVTTAPQVAEFTRLADQYCAGGVAFPRVVAGGERRQDSVERGLEALAADYVLVHDGARPLLEPQDFRRFIDVLVEFGAAALGYPASDSVKEASDRDPPVIGRNLARDRVWLVQTPQGGRRERLLEALDEAKRRGIAVTDEAAALEIVGVRVALVEGPRANIKVTYPGDLALAEFLVEQRERERGGTC